MNQLFEQLSGCYLIGDIISTVEAYPYWYYDTDNVGDYWGENYN